MSPGSDCPSGKAQLTPENAAAEENRHRHVLGDRGMRAYRCRRCGCWHLGHRSPAAKRKEQRRQGGARRVGRVRR